MTQIEVKVGNVKIDKDVNRPLSFGKRNNKWFIIFTKMAIDDSFAIPFKTDEDIKRIQQSINNGKRWYNKLIDKDFRGTTRTLYNKKEVRFWRDK